MEQNKEYILSRASAINNSVTLDLGYIVFDKSLPSTSNIDLKLIYRVNTPKARPMDNFELLAEAFVKFESRSAFNNGNDVIVQTSSTFTFEPPSLIDELTEVSTQ